MCASPERQKDKSQRRVGKTDSTLLCVRGQIASARVWYNMRHETYAKQKGKVWAWTHRRQPDALALCRVRMLLDSSRGRWRFRLPDGVFVRWHGPSRPRDESARRDSQLMDPNVIQIEILLINIAI